MQSRLIELLKTSWTLFRIIALISSSIVIILSSLLPLFMHTSISTSYLIYMFVFLSSAAIIVHGGLTHLLNDYADYQSGTDEKSPAVLSGGSRVIQKNFLSPETVFNLGKWVTISLLIIALISVLFGYFEITILILVGVWAAVSYSLPPLQLSYRPFIGEWLSMFPAVFFIGIAGPWIILESIPLWAYQNALINGLICMTWVMIHHIPDLEADRAASPKKETSIVWFIEKFGLNFAKYPALIYYLLALLFTVWILFSRFWTGLIVIILLLIGLFFINNIRPTDIDQVTKIEKIILLSAIVIAIVLGIF